MSKHRFVIIHYIESGLINVFLSLTYTSLLCRYDESVILISDAESS